jgi:hypothetical protein
MALSDNFTNGDQRRLSYETGQPLYTQVSLALHPFSAVAARFQFCNSAGVYWFLSVG